MKKNNSESFFIGLTIASVCICLSCFFFIGMGCEVRVVTPQDKLEMRLKNLENKIDIFDHRLDVQWVELMEIKEKVKK